MFTRPPARTPREAFGPPDTSDADEPVVHTMDEASDAAMPPVSVRVLCVYVSGIFGE